MSDLRLYFTFSPQIQGRELFNDSVGEIDVRASKSLPVNRGSISSEYVFVYIHGYEYVRRLFFLFSRLFYDSR